MREHYFWQIIEIEYKERNFTNAVLVLLNSFAKKAHLSVHITTVHEEKKDFKSNVCDVNFSLRIFLKNHFTSVHNMEKTELRL